MFGHALRSP
jgi:hypothetical protein